MLSALTWGPIPQTISMLSSVSRQQTAHCSSPSANAQRFPIEDACSHITLYWDTLQKHLYRQPVWCLTHIFFFFVKAKLLQLLLLLVLQINAVVAHGEPVWITRYTVVIDTDNKALTRGDIFYQFILLTCSPGHWLWIHTRLFWKVSLRKGLRLHPHTASWGPLRDVGDVERSSRSYWRTVRMKSMNMPTANEG